MPLCMGWGVPMSREHTYLEPDHVLNTGSWNLLPKWFEACFLKLHGLFLLSILPQELSFQAWGVDKQQLLGSELGDAGRDIYIYVHKAPGSTAWGGGKKRQEYGAGVTTAFLLFLFCQVMVQNLKEYKNSEFEAGLPSLFESQNIFYFMACCQCGHLLDLLPQDHKC